MIEKSNDRGVSGDELKQALLIGLPKVLKEKVDPDTISIVDSENCVIEGAKVTCKVTGSTRGRKPRKTTPAE